MKRKRIIQISLIGLMLYAFFHFRNHARLFIMKNIPVQNSNLTLYKKIDENNFILDVYTCSRSYKSRLAQVYNSFFSDQIAVFQIPLKKYAFNNLVMQPIGSDEISDNANLYFNTMFFDSNYVATKGVIDDKQLINTKNPRKRRIGIDQYGRLTSFTENQNAVYNDVLQAPFTFSPRSKVNLNFRTLNYRQFISIKDNKLLFISGFNNSLISWVDIKSLMPKLGLTSIIALDGGASVEYAFEGEKSNYYFSSVPLRHVWFRKNSPYYLEGKQIGN
jgi:hypothetical protein